MIYNITGSPCRQYDVAVVGGGPAGSVAALCIARFGSKTVLLESDGEKAGYGETLAPECNPLLRRLGLWETFQRSRPLESPGIVSYWGRSGPSQQDFVGNAHGSGWHVDRMRFDAELRLEAERAGVTVMNRERVSQVFREKGWWRLGAIEARYLVDASGRNGLRIDAPAKREIDDCLLVHIFRISYRYGGPKDWRTVIASTPSGWWYWSPLPDGNAIAMFFTCREEYHKIRRLARTEWVRPAPSICELIGPGRIVESRWISASSSIRKVPHGDGWIAAGDSLSSFDPLSGRGIFNALRSASLAAEAVHAPLHGRSAAINTFESRLRMEFMDYVRQRKLRYREEQRWPSNSFWQGRQRADDHRLP
jgi:flavin-dependent dehydrogenase